MSYGAGMIVEEIEAAILALPPAEKAKIAEWFTIHRQELVSEAAETDAMKAELRRRKQEYLEHPERFVRFETEEEMNAWFEDIRREVDARVSSARQV